MIREQGKVLVHENEWEPNRARAPVGHAAAEVEKGLRGPGVLRRLSEEAGLRVGSFPFHLHLH